ncbi:hypothetical protein V8E55_004601 [Tylopilus felleus]
MSLLIESLVLLVYNLSNGWWSETSPMIIGGRILPTAEHLSVNAIMRTGFMNHASVKADVNKWQPDPKWSGNTPRVTTLWSLVMPHPIVKAKNSSTFTYYTNSHADETSYVSWPARKHQAFTRAPWHHKKQDIFDKQRPLATSRVKQRHGVSSDIGAKSQARINISILEKLQFYHPQALLKRVYATFRKGGRCFGYFQARSNTRIERPSEMGSKEGDVYAHWVDSEKWCQVWVWQGGTWVQSQQDTQ